MGSIGYTYTLSFLHPAGAHRHSDTARLGVGWLQQGSGGKSIRAAYPGFCEAHLTLRFLEVAVAYQMSFRYNSQEELNEHLSALLEEDAEKVHKELFCLSMYLCIYLLIIYFV